MSDAMKVQAQYSDELRFEVLSSSGQQISVDSDGEGSRQLMGSDPLELILAGLAGCAGTSVITILKKQRQDIQDYSIAVQGTRTSQPPRVFSSITLEHSITGRHLKPAAIERAIKLTKERYCAVEAMLGKAVRIEHTVRIIESGSQAQSEVPIVAIF